MKSNIIKINNIKDLKEFVLKANMVSGDVLIHRGKFVIDGKSILGIMSIDTTDGCKVVYPEDAIDFEEFITKFKV